jgi:hypothetical protein
VGRYFDGWIWRASCFEHEVKEGEKKMGERKMKRRVGGSGDATCLLFLHLLTRP